MSWVVIMLLTCHLLWSSKIPSTEDLNENKPKSTVFEVQRWIMGCNLSRFAPYDEREAQRNVLSCCCFCCHGIHRTLEHQQSLLEKYWSEFHPIIKKKNSLLHDGVSQPLMKCDWYQKKEALLPPLDPTGTEQGAPRGPRWDLSKERRKIQNQAVLYLSVLLSCLQECGRHQRRAVAGSGSPTWAAQHQH